MSPASPHPFVPDEQHPTHCVMCGRREQAHTPKQAQ